jgi:hypothetical protein
MSHGNPSGRGSGLVGLLFLGLLFVFLEEVFDALLQKIVDREIKINC